jgi:xanthine dehydrogenase accessory factor
MSVLSCARAMEVSRKVMRRAVELLDDGESFALCTVVSARGSVPGKTGAKMIVRADGSQFGTVGGAGLEEKCKDLGRRCIAERRTLTQRFELATGRPGALDSLCGGAVEILVEFMGAVPHVLICGGGHVGLEVARLCDQLEYVHSVLDDRVEFASRERFPSARELHVGHPEQFFPAHAGTLSHYSHVVLLGYSYKIDTEALYQCVTRFRGFTGLICSRLKRREMFAKLRERGVAEADLERVEAPLGVSIAAETPAEIAVSILGSIIQHHKRASTSATSPSEVNDVDEEEQEAGKVQPIRGRT